MERVCFVYTQLIAGGLNLEYQASPREAQLLWDPDMKYWNTVERYLFGVPLHSEMSHICSYQNLPVDHIYHRGSSDRISACILLI